MLLYIFVPFLSIFAIALFCVAYFLGWKSRHKNERCTEKTTGEVIRYSLVQYNDVNLPVSEFFVDGKSYTVTGPKFKAGVQTYVSHPFSKAKADVKSNIKVDGELPDTLRTHTTQNSLSSVRKSPLIERYPVGKEVTVFYNPKNPKDAYVERHVPVNQFLGLYLPILAGIGLIIMTVALIIKEV